MEEKSKADILYREIVGLMEKELNCVVCHEVFVKPSVVSCGHTFCFYCICQWSKEKKECPICRKVILDCKKHVEMDNFLTKLHTFLSLEIQAKRLDLVNEREKIEEKQAREACSSASYRREASYGANAPVHLALGFLIEEEELLHQHNNQSTSSRPPGYRCPYSTQTTVRIASFGERDILIRGRNVERGIAAAIERNSSSLNTNTMSTGITAANRGVTFSVVPALHHPPPGFGLQPPSVAAGAPYYNFGAIDVAGSVWPNIAPPQHYYAAVHSGATISTSNNLRMDAPNINSAMGNPVPVRNSRQPQPANLLHADYPRHDFAHQTRFDNLASPYHDRPNGSQSNIAPASSSYVSAQRAELFHRIHTSLPQGHPEPHAHARSNEPPTGVNLSYDYYRYYPYGSSGEYRQYY